MELGEDLQRLGLVVGRVAAVSEHAGARAPSYLLTLDLGPQGRHECSVARGEYEPSGGPTATSKTARRWPESAGQTLEQ